MEYMDTIILAISLVSLILSVRALGRSFESERRFFMAFDQYLVKAKSIVEEAYREELKKHDRNV